MNPVLALVGRPNVGKSTLFNRLTQTRDALVADEPGLTRDRKYGRGRIGERPYIVIDTGGLTGDTNVLDEQILKQALYAMDEADAVLFLVDGREGLNAQDEILAQRLRALNRPIFLVVNKCERLQKSMIEAEFHTLGFAHVHAVSSSHGEGIPDLMDAVLAPFPAAAGDTSAASAGCRVAVVGRPNVGKSTLVNRLLGEERMVTYDMPGTTRDSIEAPFVWQGTPYVLIDTAGVRRRGKIDEKIEKFSAIKALQAIEEANVVIMVVDAREGVTEQDSHLLGYVVEAGKSFILTVNKWDGLDNYQRERVRTEIDRRLDFIDYVPVHYISALHGSGVGLLMQVVAEAYASAMRDLSTPELSRMLEEAIQAHQPPLVHGRRIKLRYAHQGGRNPPVIIVHGTQTERVPEAYRRYLSNMYRNALKLVATPLRIEFKSSENPYAGRRNTLTPRQVEKRRRLMKHLKKKYK
ncbi:MAG: ribosome biogenesis GTPase Der [Gammaproteobacteria bacterium]|nr:ribosome biogenesis GTPase Der [Gammaproteobacteria bacterium]